jgi:hypothetical protein
MAVARSHSSALEMFPDGPKSQNPALCLVPEGRIENSPGWSPPQRTEPWENGQTARRASRRAARRLSPHIARIVFDAMFLQERDELCLKIALSMMFFLARDVRNCSARLRHPDGECAVTLLPFKISTMSCLVHPERRGTFNLANGLCNRDRGRKRKQNVNVVLSAANSESLEAMFSRNSAHVCPKPRLDFLRDRCAAFLRGEDAMEQR